MSQVTSQAGLLRSISVAQQRVSTYQDHLGAFGPGSPRRGRPVVAPLDSLLLALYLGFRGGRSTVLDLAAAPSLGLSTMIAATHEAVKAVRIPTPDHAPESYWYEALSEFLDELGPDLSRPVDLVSGLEATRETPAAASRSGRMAPIDLVMTVLGDAPDGEAARRLDEAIAQAGGRPILVLGLGPVGRCPGVAELVARSAQEGPARLFLFRELAGVLGESRIGLYCQDPEAESSALERVSSYFTGNFDFVQMVDGVCRAAVAATLLDEPTRQKLLPSTSRSGIDSDRVIRMFLDANRERNELRQDVDKLLMLIWSMRQERRELEQMIGTRVSSDSPLEQEVLPDLGANLPAVERRSLVIRFTKAWRQDGVGGVMRRISSRAKAAARSRRQGVS